jgi:hypothetical protein
MSVFVIVSVTLFLLFIAIGLSRYSIDSGSKQLVKFFIAIIILSAIYIGASFALIPKTETLPVKHYELYEPKIIVDEEWNKYYQIFFQQGTIRDVKDYYPDFLDPSMNQQVLIKTYYRRSLGLEWPDVTRYYILQDTGGVVNNVDK